MTNSAQEVIFEFKYYVQFDWKLEKDKLCCVLDLFEMGPHACMQQ